MIIDNTYCGFKSLAYIKTERFENIHINESNNYLMEES